MLFLDSSALVKEYIEEKGTRIVRGAMLRRPGGLFMSDLVALEVLTTIRVALRRHSEVEYDRMVDEFWSDYRLRFNRVPVDADAATAAMKLTTAKRAARARSMDVLHVATALQLQAELGDAVLIVVTSDRELAALAEECGLRTFDPSGEPLAALPRAPRR